MPTTIPALFEGLVDDAAVFPPGNVPIADAVTAHRRHRDAWYAPFVGPLLCPAARLDELRELAGGIHADQKLDVAIVVDTGTAGVLDAVDAVAHDARLVLRGVEIPVRGEPLTDFTRRTTTVLDAALGGPDDDEPASIEIPLVPGWEAALDVVADSGYRAKLRTGGDDPSAVPTPGELAAFVVACLDRGVAFKLTAGLHHAVARPGPEGGIEHGFLNAALAVAHALDGGDVDAVTTTVELDDMEDVTARVRALPDERTAKLRRWFASFGSCSIHDPLADLIDLRLLAEPDTVGP